MKQKQLHSHWKGNKPLTADKLSENDFIIFKGKEILDPFTPRSLTNSMLKICTNDFGMMSVREIDDSGLFTFFFGGGGLKSKCDSAENIE